MSVVPTKAQEIIDFWFRETPIEKDLKEMKNLMSLLRNFF